MVGETMGHDLKPQVELTAEHMVKNRIKTFYAIIKKVKEERERLDC